MHKLHQATFFIHSCLVDYLKGSHKTSYFEDAALTLCVNSLKYLLRISVCYSKLFNLMLKSNFQLLQHHLLLFLSFQAKLSGSPVFSTISFPQCLTAPTQRLQYYCEILEELGGVNPGPDSALSIIRHVQRHGEDLRISDLIAGCPVRLKVHGLNGRLQGLCFKVDVIRVVMS